LYTFRLVYNGYYQQTSIHCCAQHMHQTEDFALKPAYLQRTVYTPYATYHYALVKFQVQYSDVRILTIAVIQC
jgi:hypothetical protein